MLFELCFQLGLYLVSCSVCYFSNKISHIFARLFCDYGKLADAMSFIVRELRGQKCPERGQKVRRLYLT